MISVPVDHKGESMERSTDELLQVLLSGQDMQTYLDENEQEFVTAPLSEYLESLLRQRGAEKSVVIAAAQIERSYGYQIFSGRRANPSRDVLLALALAMHLTLEETQTLLRVAHLALLYPRIRRDSVLIRALVQGDDVMHCNAALEACGETVLGEGNA